jgi:hypothetical protein
MTRARPSGQASEQRRRGRSSRAFLAFGMFGVFGHSIPTCLNIYHLDVERMCDAEHRSGLTVKTDAAGVQAWLQRNIASPEGVVLLGQLQNESAKDRAVQLRFEAKRQSIAACPLADSFDVLAVEEDYKAAVGALCAGEKVNSQGGVARLDVAQASDADRLSEIASWTRLNLSSPGTQELVDRMAAATVKDRGGVLRAEGAKLGITSCPLADVLDKAPPPSGASLVALPYFTVSSVDPPRLERIVTEAFFKNPAQGTIDACYGPALAKSPKLAGTLGIRSQMDLKGKLVKVEDGGGTLGSAAVSKCIVNGMSGITLVPTGDKPEKMTTGLLKFTVTLALSPQPGIPPPGWPSFAPPAASPDVTPDAGAPAAGKKKRGR